MPFKSTLYNATFDYKNKRIFFWGGIFSQWAKCRIIDVAINREFNCAEQAMMYGKAITFQDGDAVRAVMNESNPANQKAIGRTIKGFDAAVWDEVCFDIVRRNNFFKFSQNPEWRELLILTDGYEIVEASPFDKIWGVGLAEDDPRIIDPSNWDGKNLLGKAIMEAREQILKEFR